VTELNEVNAQALHVVAQELASTLNDARASLEASLERPGDAAPLSNISDLLKQARGVLRVVEVHGGALLAEEMEHTARFLARGADARQQADGLDALMRAIVQLPTYLERVLGGGRDLALVLLPLLNDLRAVRGASLLSEGTLLSLNLISEQQPRSQPQDDTTGLTVPQRARRLRPRFQFALLGLIRGDRVGLRVDSLIEVAEQIEAAATTAPVFQLWWVVGALLEALKSGGLEDSASIKRLLGQADRELRRLYELGEDRYAEAPPLDLLNNLLFYVARATTDGPRIAAVRSSFRLNELLPVDEAVGQEQESLSGPSVKLMHTVAAAIKEDLGRVKDALDLFTRKGGQPEELEPQVELLKKISDTLAVLGLGTLRETVQGELGRLAALVARNVPAERDTLIGIAAALISVEDSLDDSLVKLIMPPGAPLAGVIQDPEFRQVAEAVLRECSVNLARIKELVAQALEPGADLAGIDSVPALARGISAGLLMLGKTRATEIMSRIGHHIVQSLQPGGERLPPRVIDRLADSVVSLEYYMETLQAGRGDPWYMLDNAERCLAAVEARSGTVPPVAELEAAPAEAEAEVEPEATLIIERPAELAAAAELPEAWQQPAPASTEPVEPASPAMMPAAASSVDPEMLEVFIEEAREEIGAVRGLFPLWDENPADRESLVRVRRAFHTLKGSGRMVGATMLGELAWSVEDLLNRIIDGTRTRTPAVLAALRESVAVLPGMVDALERGDTDSAAATALVSHLQAVAAGAEESLPAEPEREKYEPTLMIATLDEATMAKMLERVPPIDAAVPPAAAPEQAPPTAESPAEYPVEIAAGPAEEAAVETVPEEAEPPPDAGIVIEPEEIAVPQEEFGPEPAVESEPYAAMDPSLQDIFRKEVQLHLDVLRDYLRKVWVSPGPHYVTDDLYRACHTLRGASRTAESPECIRLADPLHRWLRRLFDSDRPFDDEGLATLADSVAVFEDIVDSVGDGSDFFPALQGLIARLAALDLALEQAIATEPVERPGPGEEAAPVDAPAEETEESAEPTAIEAPFSIEHLIPGIVVDAGTPRSRPGTSFDRLLPHAPEEQSVESEVPYLTDDVAEPAAAEQAEPVVAEPATPEQVEPAAAEQAEPVTTEPAAAEQVEPVAAEPAATEQAEPVVAEPAAPEQVEPAAAGADIALRLPSVVEEVARGEGELLDVEGRASGEPEETAEPVLEAEETEPVVAAEIPAAPGVEEEPVQRAAPEPVHEVGDYDADIAAIFSEEATELLEAADSALGALRAERGSRERVVELQRALHTLKGGARMAGIPAMGDLSHELESLLIQVGGAAVPLDERTFEVLQASLDELNRMRDFVNAGRGVRAARDLITRIQLVGHGATPAPVVEPPEIAAPEPTQLDQAHLIEEDETLAAAEAGPGATSEEPLEVAAAESVGELPLLSEEPETTAEPAPRQLAEPPPVLPGREGVGERAEMARVDADLLDTMLNNAGEVSIFRSRLEQQLSSVDFNLAELARVVQRLKEQLRKLEIETEAQILHRHVEHTPSRTDFDPLELDRYSAIQQYSRALGETASDVASIQGLLGSLTREAQNLLTQQGRIVSDLQNSLMRTRMVPFQRHVQRLTRIVRQAAAELGKRADLTVTGAAGEIDRQVLERMLPPFEHLVRNAVVHGIESPEERIRCGKPETGRIELTLKREGSEVVIVVADDGAGINLRAVREKAVALGIASPKQELSDEQATQLILEPGFTTAGRVTQSAGRGVGMDVVATEIKKLGGALFIECEEGRGTQFTVRLPFTLAISQALVVRAGEEFFALPLPTVEGVVRVPAVEVQRQLAADAAGFEYGGQQYRFQHLSSFVGGEPAPPAEHDPAVPVILVRAGEHSTGIVTDELIGSREIVVKSVGPQIAGIRGISGATILGDGRICIILDVGALVRSEWRVRPPPERPSREREDNRVFALVVDDSITVRRVTQRLLERNGMRVMTAKDGLDAIGVLQDHLPDVILLDIEMPRMDGYEVASHVRNDPRLKDVPIVMITSRVGEKHRARAIELGVNDYLGKPYQETQLLQALEPLLQRRRAS
jgi:chemosensory pili system protein ChpA (sensor histidine kinase/response regulator)